MPDQKVDQYNPATSWVGSELLYLVQSALDKHISLTNLFASIPVLAKFTGKFGFSNVDVMTAAGTIDLTKTVTRFDGSTAYAVTLPNGLFDGQVKILLGNNSAGVNCITINSNFAASPNPWTFTYVGDSAILMFTASKWWILGAYGGFSF